MNTTEPYMTDAHNKSRQELLREIARLRQRGSSFEGSSLELADQLSSVGGAILLALRDLPDDSRAADELHTALAHLERAGTLARYLIAEARSTGRPRADRKILEAWGTETVLLVEDEHTVRSVVERWLEKQGYSVVAAGSPTEVSGRLDELPRTPDLLITDVLLQDDRGPELYAELVVRFPGLRVLYMSGSAPDELDAPGLAPEAAFIQKPFTPAALALKIREVLSDE